MKRLHSRRPRRGALLAVLAGSTLGAGVLAGVAVMPLASAQGAQTDSMAQVEICKAYTTPTINELATPTFSFTISSVASPVTLTAGAGAGNYLCTRPISVTPGVVTITEAPGTWYTVGSITEPAGDSYIQSTNLATGQVTVDVPAGNTSTVQYTNDPNNGYVEVCKSAPPGSPLTGAFTFDLTGEDQYSGTATSQVGGCSGPVEVPAGNLTATEAGTNLYVTSITAAYNLGPGTSTGDPIVASPPPPFLPLNLTMGTVTVNVKPSTSESQQTDVYYTDDVVQFKVCKVWRNTTTASASTPTTPFTFDLTATGVAGPTAVPATISLSVPAQTLRPGTATQPVCSNPVPLRAGTTVTVTEEIVPGTKVGSIAATGALSVPVPPVPNPDPVNRTVTVVMGVPTTSTDMSWANGSSVNEGVVTFTDQPADPGPLKICVTAGSTAPAGTSFAFTTSGGPVLPTNVPVNGCNIVGGAGDPFLFPYNSTVDVTGTNVSPDVASAITAAPEYVTESRGPTTEPVIVPGSIDLATPSVSVMTSEDSQVATVVTFTIGGAGSSSSGGGTSTSSSGGGTSSGTSSSGGGSSSSSSGGSSTTDSSGTGGSPTVFVPLPPASTPSTPSTPSVSGPSAPSASGASSATPNRANAALLGKYKDHLKSVEKDLATTRTSLQRYHAQWHKASANHWRDRTVLLHVVQRLLNRFHALATLRHQLIVSIGNL